MKVALSGFGRIGREVVRIILQDKPENLDLVALNLTGDIEKEMMLFKYDSLYGKFQGDIEVKEDRVIIDGKEIRIVSDRDPAKLPWKDLGVELVIDSTGAFKDMEGLGKHIEAGAKKVILTAPGKGLDNTIVMGVNDQDYDPEKDNIISNASCTTNCLAPVAKVIMEEFGIVKGLMTTIHAYTGDQNIHDGKHKDPRRARAAALSMVPTTTGAAKAVAEVLPDLEGKLDGYAVRVPTPTVSLVDVVFQVDKQTTKEEINQALKKASEGDLKGILGFSEEPLVSIDYQGDERSSIVDSLLTNVKDDMVKIVSWYDNEWGYSNRTVDLAKLVARG